VTQKPNIGSLTGIWTYRSLLNDPDVSTDFDKLEFGRGNIRIDDAPMGVFAGSIFGPGWSLDLNGSIGYGTPWAVRFQGKGIVGGEEWIYDYIGYVVPPWPNGVKPASRDRRLDRAHHSAFRRQSRHRVAGRRRRIVLCRADGLIDRF